MADLAFRAHTWDENIWKSVAHHDEYGLPESFGGDDVILDVGAHIGAFAYACLDRGAGKVLCVEPDPENFLYLRHNLHSACKATDRAICLSAACWRSDGFHRLVHYGAVGANTGGGNTLGREGLPVAAVPFAALVRLACALSPWNRVRLVKLDCEGAEWPILFTADSRLFQAIDAFVGEYHTLQEGQFPGLELPHSCRPEVLAGFFVGRGYEFRATPTGKDLGLFRAWRRGWEV